MFTHQNLTGKNYDNFLTALKIIKNSFVSSLVEIKVEAVIV